MKKASRSVAARPWMLYRLKRNKCQAVNVRSLGTYARDLRTFSANSPIALPIYTRAPISHSADRDDETVVS